MKIENLIEKREKERKEEVAIIKKIDTQNAAEVVVHCS